MLACPSPNAYSLAMPQSMRCSPTLNVDRLKPFFECVGTQPAPWQVSDAGQENKHQMELLPPGREAYLLNVRHRPAGYPLSAHCAGDLWLNMFPAAVSGRGPVVFCMRKVIYIYKWPRKKNRKNI